MSRERALDHMDELIAERDDLAARVIVAEAALAQIKDMWGPNRWLRFSSKALHQIRDEVLAVIESWERARESGSPQGRLPNRAQEAS